MTISKVNSISFTSFSKMNNVTDGSISEINDQSVGSSFDVSRSIDLNGSNQYVDLGDLSSTALEPTQSTINTNGLSFTAWVYIDTTSGNAIYNIGNSGTNNYGGFKVIANANGAFVLHVMGLNAGFFGSGSNNRNTIRTANSTLTSGRWYHLAAVIPAGSLGTTQNRNNWVLYIDGSAYSGTYTRSGNQNVTLNYLGDSSLGAWTRASLGSPFDGEMNNLAIFNVGLDASNIAAIYNSGSPIDLSTDSGNYNQSENLAAWWRFNETSGSTYADSSGNGFTGSGVNSPGSSTNVPS